VFAWEHLRERKVEREEIDGFDAGFLDEVALSVLWTAVAMVVTADSTLVRAAAGVAFLVVAAGLAVLAGVAVIAGQGNSS
jgi:hypothetical protein